MLVAWGVHWIDNFAFDHDLRFYLLFTGKAGPLMVEGLEDVNKSVNFPLNIILNNKISRSERISHAGSYWLL